MSNFLEEPMKEEVKNLLARIQAHPGLEERIEAILDIMENKSGEFITADEAECPLGESA